MANSVSRTLASLPILKNRLQGRYSLTILLLLAANGASNLVQFAVTVWVARVTSPEIYGVFSIFISVMMTISMVINAGLPFTLTRLVSIEQQQSSKQPILQAVLLLELSLGALVVAALSIFSSQFTTWLQISTIHESLIPFAGITALLLAIVDYYRGLFQAEMRYDYLAGIAMSYAVFRLAGGGIVYFTAIGSIPIATFLGVLYTLPLALLVLIFGRSIIPRLGIGQVSIVRVCQQTKLVFRYTSWVALAKFGYPLLMQIPMFLLAAHASTEEVGVYSAGFVFAMVFNLFNFSARQITEPIVSRFTRLTQVSLYLRRLWSLTPFYLLGAAGLITGMGMLMLQLLGPQYATAFPVFLITSSATALVILLGQMNLLAHAIYRPDISTYQVGIQIVMLSVGGYIIAIQPTVNAFQMAIWFAIVIVGGEVGSFTVIRHLINKTGLEWEAENLNNDR